MSLTNAIESSIIKRPGIDVAGLRDEHGIKSSDVFSTIRSLERQGRVERKGSTFWPVAPKIHWLRVKWGPLPSKLSLRAYQQQQAGRQSHYSDE